MRAGEEEHTRPGGCYPLSLPQRFEAIKRGERLGCQRPPTSPSKTPLTSQSTSGPSEHSSPVPFADDAATARDGDHEKAFTVSPSSSYSFTSTRHRFHLPLLRYKDSNLDSRHQKPASYR